MTGPIALSGATIRHPDSDAGRRTAELLREGLLARGAIDVKVTPAVWGSGGTREQVSGPGTLSDIAVPDPQPETQILLGNLSSNPDVAQLYHAWLCPVDGTFPGAGGVFLRSYRDVYGDGGTIVVVGVSSDDDLGPAVDRLLTHGDGSVLNHLHEVQLSAEFREAQPTVDPDHPVYADFRELAQQGYRTRKHRGYTPYLTHLAEVFSLTAIPAFAQRYLDIMQDMMVDTAAWVPDQWGRWGFDADFQAARVISSWHAIADSPVFTDEDRARVTGHLIDFLGNSEEQWHGHRDSPFPARHNHYTFAALGLLFGALLFGKAHHLPQTPDWVAMADECFVPMLTVGKSTEDCEAYGWLTLTHTLKYALLRPVPAYFAAGDDQESPCARLLTRGITTMDNLGCQVPYGDASAHLGNFSELAFWRPAAWTLADARYTPMITTKESVRPGDPGGVTSLTSLVFRYDLPVFTGTSAPLTEGLGVHVLPLDPGFCETHAAAAEAPDDGFDKISFRDDFDAESPYLLLDGIDIGGHGHRDAGAIIRFTSKDRIWLEDAEYDKISANFHNTVIVARDGIVGSREPYAHLGEVADDGRIGGAQSILRGYSGADWTRSVVWVRGVGFLVVDDVVADEPGDYEVTALWRTVGSAEDSGDTWTITMGDARLQVHTVITTPTGVRRRRQLAEDYVPFRSDWHDYPYAEAQETVLQDTVAATLASGERTRHIHLLTDSEEDSRLTISDDGIVRGFVGEQGFVVDPARPLQVELADLRSVEPVESPLAEPSEAGSGTAEPARPIWSAPIGSGPLAVLPSGDTVVSANGCEVTVWREGRALASVTTRSTVTALGAGPQGGFVAGLDDGHLAAFTASGELLWEQEFPAHMGHRAQVNVINSARLDPGAEPAVLIGTESCHVHAYAADGEELWRYEVIHAANGVAAADLDGDGRDEVLAISGYWSWHVIGADGVKRSTVRGVEGSGGDHVLGHRGLAVFGGWDGHVTAYRPDGEQVWDVATGDVVTALVSDGDDLVVASRAGRLYRIAGDGTVRWWQPLPVADLVVTAAGVVVASGKDLLRLTDEGEIRARVGFSDDLASIWSCPRPGVGAGGVVVRDIAGAVQFVELG